MNILKKQGVAWVIAIVMIVAAIGIGQAKAGGSRPDRPGPSAETGAGWVFDDAGVLSSGDKRDLMERNQELNRSMGVVIACVTTNYGGDDLYRFAMDYAEDIGLAENDFIVVLDISGDNYWLIQGSGIDHLFTDDDCSAYAYEYLEKDFARGDYGEALLELTDALADWYDDHYLG